VENELKQRGEQGLEDNNHACSSKAIYEIVSYPTDHDSDFEEHQDDHREIFNNNKIVTHAETQTEDVGFEDDSMASSSSAVNSDDTADSDASDDGGVGPFAHRTLVTTEKRLRELERELAFFGTAQFVRSFWLRYCERP
jgi:hypothetical protein